jgi:predicted small lipoprotein YifL
MLNRLRILVLTSVASTVCVGVMLLTGCGQKGNLYIPIETASHGRASLPGSVANTASQTAQSMLRSLKPQSVASASVVEVQRELPTDPSADKNTDPSANHSSILPPR